MMSVLRLPSSMTQNTYSGPDMGAAAYRGPADGGHVDTYGKLGTFTCNCIKIRGLTLLVKYYFIISRYRYFMMGDFTSISETYYIIISRGCLKIL